jgi:hypothetical protein
MLFGDETCTCKLAHSLSSVRNDLICLFLKSNEKKAWKLGGNGLEGLGQLSERKVVT